MNNSLPITFKIYKDGELTDTKVLAQPTIKIGALSAAHLCIADETVSRMHGYVQVMGDGVWLSDLGSAHGTKVNGQRVNKAKLSSGDRVHFGDVEVVVEFAEKKCTAPQEATEETAEEVLVQDLARRLVCLVKVYYCEQCFHTRGALVELKGSVCSVCHGEWQLNQRQACHIVSMKLLQYQKLAQQLGMDDSG